MRKGKQMKIILTDRIFDDVLKERIRQDIIHKPFKDKGEAIVILMEEVGELCKAIQEGTNEYEEAIQCMAVIVKLIQQFGAAE